jgi:type IV pilus assembly protein PilY1
MKLQRTFLTSLIVFFLASAPNTGRAEDTDIYLKSPSIERDDAPNVLIILDDSSSMPGNLVTTAIPYNPTTTYVYNDTAGTGIAFDPGRIYWKRTDGSQPSIPTSEDTYPDQWFSVANNRCNRSNLPWHLSATRDIGTVNVTAAWAATLGASWGGMKTGDGVVDCKEDHDASQADTETSPSNKFFAAGGGYTDKKGGGTQFNWGGTGVSLYSGNYLNYKTQPGTTTASRLDVAKQVVKQIIDSNPGVNFGLMLFNENIPDGAKNGGYIAVGVGKQSDPFLIKGTDFKRGGAIKKFVDDLNPRPFPTNGTKPSHTCYAPNFPGGTIPVGHPCTNSTLPTIGTPLAETLWEAKLYFSGEKPQFGYIAPPPLPMPQPDLNALDGSGNYISPFKFDCQKAFVIYITDGDPWVTEDISADGFIDGLSGAGPFNGPYPSDESSKLDELARWLATQDVHSRPSKQVVITHTIGFDIDPSSSTQAADGLTLLNDTAKNSGGQFLNAKNADELQTAIQSILVDIVKTNSSFVAPSLSVNAFNRLFNRDEVYFALFKPATSVAWDGNVKKFKLKGGQTTTDALGNACVFGDVVDQNGVCAVDPVTLRIKDTASSFWGSTSDGGVVTQGGAGAQIPAPGLRQVYTYRGAYTGLSAATPQTPFLIKATAGNPLYDAAINDPTILGLPETSGSPTTTNPADTDAVKKLIEWMLSQDSYDKDPNSTIRWAHADPLHSRPVAITYGGTSADPIIKLFYAGNDGGIRMVNDANGKEEWVFYPQEILNRQFDLSQNTGGPKIHTVDGTPSFRINDVGGDGVIEPAAGDFVHMYINMRRGGKNIYAFNVTPTTKMTVPTSITDVTPKLMWAIRGGVDASYLKLGQTWSRVSVADIRFGQATAGESAAKTVLIFGGGYDANEDNIIPVQAEDPATGKIGNAIYIADPADGTRLWWASDGADSGGNTPTLTLPKMKFSIPSDLALMDANGDGEVDRIYVGDTGGQLWRIDLGETLKSNNNGDTVGHVFADVGCEGSSVSTDRPNCATTANSNRRKFFYPPDVSQVIDTNFVGSPADSRYDLVAIASGDREDPLDLLTTGIDPVHNRIYAFRDVNVDSLQGKTPLPSPLTDVDLYDATDNALQDPTNAGVYGPALTDIQTKKGWRVDLKEVGLSAPTGAPATWPWVGEKGLAEVLIFDRKLLVTTYVPANQQTATVTCDPNEGLGRFYGLNYLNATAAYDFDQDGNYTTADRAYTVGGGIPSDPVIVIREGGTTGLVGTSGGAAKPPIDGKLPRFKTFWYQK